MKAKSIHQTLDKNRNFTRGKNPRDAMDVGQRAMIKKWLDLMEVTGYTINGDLTVDVDGDVWINNRSLSEFPHYVKFGKVAGYFACDSNRLISLEGCPEAVGKSFSCAYNSLDSLEGCPKAINGNFYCNNNKKKFTIEEVRKFCKLPITSAVKVI